MHHKLTLTIDEAVYQGLYATVGKGKISQFIENLIKPHVLHTELETAYQQMAEDEVREEEAEIWTEAFIGDAHDDSSR